MDDTEYKSAFEAGQLLSEAQEIDSNPYVVIPENSKVLDLEFLKDTPRRKRGTVALTEVSSFVAYVNKHREEDYTTLFGGITTTGARFTCVFDHHAAEGPGWKSHKATFETVSTPEWVRWQSGNKREMTQEQFAAFIEDGLAEITRPSGAEMLDVAVRLEASSSVSFVSGVRLDNGNQELRYEEQTEARAGQKGVMEVPQVFEIGLKLFEGSPAYSIQARLRYRIREKQLKLWYELINPHLVVKDAVQELLVTIRSETGLTPLMGSTD